MKTIFGALFSVAAAGWLPAAVVEFKSATYEAGELRGGAIALTCTPPPGPDGVSVRVQIGFLTASPADLIQVGGTLPELSVLFHPGMSEAEAHIWFLKDDGVPEPDETLSLSLGSITGGAVLGDRTNATLIIKNAAPAFQIRGTHFLANSALENAPFAFEILRFGDTNVPASLDYRTTTNTTAAAGVDFVPAHGRLVFEPGETRKGVVALRDNGEVSSPPVPRRIIELEVSNPSANAMILDRPVVQVGIMDNEIPATLELGFSPDFDRWPAISSVAALPDGKILITGFYLFIGGKQHALVRLNEDGSLDESFQPDFEPREPISTLAAVLPSGKIMVKYDDRGLLRLLPDGRKDTGFVPSQELLDALYRLGSMTPLRNGKVLVWGGSHSDFTVFVLNEDGSPEQALQGRLRQHEFHGLVEMPDGRLLLKIAGGPDLPHRWVRLQADGTADPTFPPPQTHLLSVLPLTDGTMIAGSLESSHAVRLVRLRSDGSLDPDFRFPFFPLSLDQIRLMFEMDGQVYFSNYSYLVRMNPDGSPDPSFYAEFNHSVHDNSMVGGGDFGGPWRHMVPHRDGILCWGSRANGIPRPLARITSDSNAPAGFVFRYARDDEFAFAAFTRGFEAEGAVEVTVVRTGNTSEPASVRYRTEDGAALDGQNYVAVAGTLQFAPFQTEAVIRITLLQDDVFRGRPDFFLALHEPSVLARLDRPRQIVVHDREPGLVAGRVFTRLDGWKELEFDVTGLSWFEPYHIEASADLRRWTQTGSELQLGPLTGWKRFVPKVAPELIEVGPPGIQFFRVRSAESEK